MIVEPEQLNLRDFAASKDRILAFEAEEVLDACQRCNWIAFDSTGRIILTDSGRRIAEAIAHGRSAEALRFQITSMVRTYDWVWAAALRHGREEAVRRMPEDARQCFAESRALESRWPRHLIAWWDELSKYQREIRSEEGMEVGRHAEELSFEYERLRTGTKPEWRALESSFNGYDILSRRSKTDTTPVRVEVKGTAVKMQDAAFWLTRHEWNTAKRSGDYVFHLWALGPQHTLSIVPFEHVEAHTPLDRNTGHWENVRIKYGPFFSGSYPRTTFKPTVRMRTPVPRRIVALSDV